jgi:hypothetical protein
LAAGADQRRDEVARGSQALVAAAGTRTAAAAAAAAAVGTRMAAAAGGAGAGRRGAAPTGGAAEGRGGWGGKGTDSGAPGTIESSGGRRETAAAAPRRSRESGAGRDTRPWRRRTRRGVWGRSASSGAVDFFSFPLYCPAPAPDRWAYWAAYPHKLGSKIMG